jgi:signal recognition particle GTPase
MENNTTKLEETKLTISLRTGLMHSNKREEAHTQNDYTSYYIGAINYFIRVALEAESLLDQQTDSTAFRNDAQFRENMQFLVQISEALAEWLPDYSHAMHDSVFGTTEAKEVESSEIVESSNESESLETLAKQISAIMKNPLVPERLYNAMTDELVENDIDSDSPEYILGNLREQKRKG